MTATDLLDALQDRGLIAADAPAPVPGDDRPWYLNLLTGAAGWVAGLFVILFLVAALHLNELEDALMTGIVLLVIATILYYASRGLVFVDQLALALSIAGQLALGVFFAEKLGDVRQWTLAVFGLQVLLFLLLPDRTAKVLAALFASIAWVFVVRFWLRPEEGVERFVDSTGHMIAPAFGVWTLPIEWLLTWAPPIAILLVLAHTEPRWMARRAAAFARPAITGLLIAVACGGVGAEPASQLFLDGGSIGRDFTWWALIPLLSIGLALFAAWHAFRMRSAGLTGLAIVAALAHLGRFYYMYGTTLTVKATIMLAVGLVLLGAGRLLGRHVEGAA